MPQRLSLLVFVMALLATVSPSAEACRYSVRDVGFVEIHPNPYRLRVSGGEVESTTSLQELFSLSRMVLTNTNIVVEADSRTSPGSDKEKSFSVVFESPDSEIGPLSIPSTSKETWAKSLETLASSEVRGRYLERMHDIYGAILLIESEDAQANDRARAAVEEVVTKTKEYMTQIPKPVNEPPEVFSVPNDGSERILIWSLGIEDRRTPHVAVLFGRGRRIGEVLSGADIATESLYEILSVIGLDCECGLDRSWMQGTCVPLRWDEETQEKTARALDFDPENPMVKMEISQILSQGGLGTRRLEGAASDPFFGYSERSVSFKKLDFESDSEGSGEEIPAAFPRPSTVSSVAENNPSPLGLPPLPAAHADEGPSGGLPVLAVGILISLGLSIFAIGFYILLRASRLEP